MYKNNFISYEQYLFGLFFPRNVKKTNTDQSVPHFFSSLSLSLWKERTRKPLKVVPAHLFSSSVHIIGTTCFD